MTPLVLHVLPVDLARGAQTYARTLRDRLDGHEVRHRTVTLFRADGGSLRPDLGLDVGDGLMRRLGLDVRALRRLRRAIRRERPTVVVAHGGEPLKYAVLARASGARLVYYKIGAGNPRLGGARGLLHRWLLRRVDLVAAVSESAAAEAGALGVRPDRLRVLPNGRDPSVYRPGTADEVTPVHIVFVGHLDPPKRPERFLELVGALRRAGVELRASIAGDGPLLDALAPRARAVDVAVLGRVEDVPALLATSDVLVLPSAMEGMPGVLIEAGMAGLPVVTTDVPGASEVVDHGRTGFVVPIDDFDALVDATRVLASDAALRQRLGRAAREHCATRFGLDASARAWQDALSELIAEPCTSSI